MISALFMKFNLYGLVIAYIQQAPAKRTPCSSEVYAGKCIDTGGTCKRWSIDVYESNRQ